MKAEAPAVPPRDAEHATRTDAGADRRSVRVPQGESTQLVYVQKWLRYRDQHAIGLVKLSSEDLPLPVYNFTVAAACQDAELKGYPVVPDIRYGREHYLAGLKEQK